MTRALLLVMDSFGIGGAEDAASFGDAGADTLGHIAAACAAGRGDRAGLRTGPLAMPNLTRLGLGQAARLSTGTLPPGLEASVADEAIWGFGTETSTGKDAPSVSAEVAIGCDGINSAVRKQFYPDEQVAFAGINTWRGVTRRKPILTGRSYMRVGSIRTGKIVIYPIIDNVDGNGNQLINWMAEIKRDDARAQNDWNKPGNLADFFPIYESWRFDWLDVAQMIRDADQILEYPMVDKDPIAQWTFGRVTLAGDAAHPMYPRGSNGGAQAVIDARTLAECLASAATAPAATLDLTALTFLNSNGIKCLANFVRRHMAQPADQRYRLVLRYSPEVTWQRATLKALATMARDAITLEAI